MATCQHCDRKMGGTSCTATRAYPWGAEPIWSGELADEGPVTWSCRDCGTPPGGRHHEGCCVAACALGCRNPMMPTEPAQAMLCRHAPDDDDREPDELRIPAQPETPARWRDG